MSESLAIITGSTIAILFSASIILIMSLIVKHSIENNGKIRRLVYKFIYGLRGLEIISDLKLEGDLNERERFNMFGYHSDRYVLIKVKHRVFILTYRAHGSIRKRVEIFPSGVLNKSTDIKTCDKAFSLKMRSGCFISSAIFSLTVFQLN